MAPEQTRQEDDVVHFAPTQVMGSGPSRGTVVMPDGTQRMPLGSGMITAFLGEGGMANVYEIWNPQLEVRRAVKLINPNCSRDARERFQTEMKISAKLHHPNITEIYGVGVWNGLPYIEMEKLEGLTLDELLRQRGALPPAVCSAIGIMVGRALKYAHSQQYAIYGKNYTGVVHRDLKPANIMICRNGTVKLMDFGIASPAEASFHTVAGTVLGTLQYLSPEQLECKKLDVRSDIYSLGATLYEVLTGVMAFPEPGVHKLMLDKLKGRFKALREYKLRTPHRLKRLVHRCMQQDPGRRVPSAVALLAQLGAVHESLTADAPEQVMRQVLATPAAQKVVVAVRRTWPLRLAAGIALAAGVVWAGWSAAQWYASRPPAASSAAAPTAQPAAAPRPAVPPALPDAARPSVSRPASTRVAAASVAPVAAPAPAAPLSLAERLRRTHESDDLQAIMVKEYKAGGYDNALALYAELTAQQRGTAEAQVYRLRALAAKGDKAGLKAAAAEASAGDGEVMLVRARLAWDAGRTADALAELQRAEAAPHQFMDYEQVKREVCYYRALCATRVFDDNMNDANYKASVQAWWELRNQLRSQPGHQYNATAAAETQRIGQKYRQSKGG